MITTVTLNAAIDKTYYIPSFSLNKVNRVASMAQDPGGKGINVAKIVKILQLPLMTTGFLGGYNGLSIKKMLDDIAIKHHFITVNGESRCCLNIIDDRNNSQTELLEQGPNISPEDWAAFKTELAKLSAKSKVVTLSGSLPQGMKSNAYVECIDIIQEKGAKAIVDTSGEALEHVIRAKPYMVKPNLEEFAALLQMKTVSEQAIVNTLQDWSESKGIPLVVVSMGSNGAILSHYGTCYKVIPPSIQAINPVGSGDAFVAGMTAGIHQEMDPVQMMKLATAAGSANALESKAGMMTLENFEKLKGQVTVEKLI
ncbi:1-phosphofructokinase [Pseudalkalibacillus decolorationis]|uniref:1-phosphofructokinase n=1 Tax=Pseudalkalibacillus decolorationis TaxID=163879 RepID=UPI002147E4FC|nr:1-phosphofructokinase [Pseudalkalibacillus decolorationis]